MKQINKKKKEFLSMLLGTSEASLIRNMLTGKGLVRAGCGNKKGKGMLTTGYGNKIDF